MRCVNTCASTDGARRAQNCAVFTSVCFVVSVQLFAMCSRLFMLCVRMYAVCRSLLYHKMFVNIRCKMYCIYTPVGDSRLSSVVTDIFTVKILNSLHVETLSANRYRTTKERVAPCYQWSYHLRGEYSKSDSHQFVCHCQDEEEELCDHFKCCFSSSACLRRYIVDNAFLKSG